MLVGPESSITVTSPPEMKVGGLFGSPAASEMSRASEDEIDFGSRDNANSGIAALRMKNAPNARARGRRSRFIMAASARQRRARARDLSRLPGQASAKLKSQNAGLS